MLVFMLHSLVDVDLRYLPNQSLLWLLMGLLVGRSTTPSDAAPFALRSKAGAMVYRGGMLVLGIWVSTSAVIHPMAADWLDRQARSRRRTAI